MEELLGGGKSRPGLNKFVSAQNDTSNYVRNVVLDASGSFFISNTTGNATRPALWAPQANLTGVESHPAAYGSQMTRRASDYWLPSLGPLGSVSLEGHLAVPETDLHSNLWLALATSSTVMSRPTEPKATVYMMTPKPSTPLFKMVSGVGWNVETPSSKEPSSTSRYVRPPRWLLPLAFTDQKLCAQPGTYKICRPIVQYVLLSV